MTRILRLWLPAHAVEMLAAVGLLAIAPPAECLDGDPFFGCLGPHTDVLVGPVWIGRGFDLHDPAGRVLWLGAAAVGATVAIVGARRMRPRAAG